MDKLKKTIELVGSHQNVLSHYVIDPGVNLTTQEMFDVLIKEIEQYKHTLTHNTKEIKLLTAEIDSKDEKIERLEKEKEWLAEELIELYERYTTTDMTTEEMKKMLFEEMQQALKEK